MSPLREAAGELTCLAEAFVRWTHDDTTATEAEVLGTIASMVRAAAVPSPSAPSRGDAAGGGRCPGADYDGRDSRVGERPCGAARRVVR